MKKFEDPIEAGLARLKEELMAPRVQTPAGRLAGVMLFAFFLAIVLLFGYMAFNG